MIQLHAGLVPQTNRPLGVKGWIRNISQSVRRVAADTNERSGRRRCLSRRSFSAADNLIDTHCYAPVGQPLCVITWISRRRTGQRHQSLVSLWELSHAANSIQFRPHYCFQHWEMHTDTVLGKLLSQFKLTCLGYINLPIETSVQVGRNIRWPSTALMSRKAWDIVTDR